MILISWVLATILSISAADRVYRDFSQPTSQSGPGSGDWTLYRAVAARLADGAPYYETLGEELRDRGYPRASVFNWRTPAHLWIVSRPGAHILAPLALGFAAFASLVLAWRLLRRSVGMPVAAVGVVAFLLALLPAVSGDVYLLSEVCAGGLIALSALLFADGRVRGGIAIAMTAIFVREFALIYYAVAAVSRVRVATRREIALWIAGGLAWSLYFAIHTTQVMRTAGTIEGQPGRWLGGGLAFVLQTIEENALLGVLPGLVVAAIAPALLVGIGALPGRETRALRGGVFAYVLLFLFVGRPIHPYWGNLYAPLISLGIPMAFLAIATLLRRATSSPGADREGSSYPR